jgi:hypothetical protein
MHITKSAPQPVLIGGRRHNVDVVGHQAIRPNLDEQVEIERVIAVFKKRLLPPITALGNMMRHPGENKAW